MKATSESEPVKSIDAKNRLYISEQAVGSYRKQQGIIKTSYRNQSSVLFKRVRYFLFKGG